MNITKVLSPNFTKGREGFRVLAVVIHIAEGSKQSVIQEFSSPATQKSSHYLVDRDGSIIQFVEEANWAYANGTISNPISELVQARISKNPNWYTCSLEHVGFATEDLTEVQYKASAELIADICKRWNIPIERMHIIKHREINDRKICPGIVNVEKLIALATAPVVIPLTDESTSFWAALGTAVFQWIKAFFSK